MHGHDDHDHPHGEPLVKFAHDDEPRRSKLLDEALATGTSLQRTLDALTRAHLSPEDKAWLDTHIARAAATAGYAGMAAWALNAFTVDDERTGRFAEALAGIGLGVLSARPR